MENNTNEVNAVAVGVHQTFEAAVNAAIASARESVWVPLKDITVPEDARPHGPEDVESRAVSMARDGQEQNALLSKEGDKLVLVYGHGRYLSAQKLGWEKLRCDIKEGLSETQKLLLILSENEERENAGPFYTAQLYQRLMEKNDWTQEKLANELGKVKSVVEKYDRLMSVSHEVRESRNALRLSLRQALEVAKLTKVDDQLMVLDECANEDLAGKALEKRVKELLSVDGGTPKPVKPAKETPVFQFSWTKDAEVAIKARYSPEKPFPAYLEKLQMALMEFLTRPQKPARATAVEESKEVPVAA